MEIKWLLWSWQFHFCYQTLQKCWYYYYSFIFIIVHFYYYCVLSFSCFCSFLFPSLSISIAFSYLVWLLGTGLLLIGSTASPTYSGFQITLGNNEDIGIQTFGANSFSFRSFPLGFDPSLDFHYYTIVYGNTFAFFVDGVLIVKTSGATTYPLRINDN